MTTPTDSDPSASGERPPVPSSTRPQVRRQVVVGVLLAVLGFAAVVQVRSTRSDVDFSGQRRDDLIELLDSLSAASERTQTQIDELDRTQNILLSSSERRQAALSETRTRLEVLEILDGTVAATGPGITVTIQDPDSAVTAASLLNGIEELRDAGAEAIEVNDNVRVVASTAFTESDGVVTVDGIEVRPPYLIDAIGSSHTLSEAVVFPGGLSDEVEQLGGHVSVDEADTVTVGALHVVHSPEYSRPTGG